MPLDGFPLDRPSAGGRWTRDSGLSAPECRWRLPDSASASFSLGLCKVAAHSHAHRNVT